MADEEPRRFDPRGPELVYVLVADDIAAKISRGELAPGDRLPGEADVALEYGVARMTAARAVRELRERGLVRTVIGKGTYVAERALGCRTPVRRNARRRAARCFARAASSPPGFRELRSSDEVLPV